VLYTRRSDARGMAGPIFPKLRARDRRELGLHRLGALRQTATQAAAVTGEIWPLSGSSYQTLTALSHMQGIVASEMAWSAPCPAAFGVRGGRLSGHRDDELDRFHLHEMSDGRSVLNRERSTSLRVRCHRT
jgi:hypothetical protein